MKKCAPKSISLNVNPPEIFRWLFTYKIDFERAGFEFEI
jgi:hypothetical protein